MAGGLEDGVNAERTCHEAMGAARYDPDRRGYRIFVGNLSGATSHDDLANLFSPFGPIVDIWLASNPPGFGFVVFKSAGDAEKAVLDKNCTIHMGRVIKVQHARMFKDRSARPSAVGLHDDSTSESERSKSRSRVSSRSRSRSRSSRSWSRSSSRLSFFSRIYGDSRARSRESSRSRSRSKSRSGSSFMTLSSAGSTSRSASRSRSGSSSRTKHRCSSRHHHSRRRERHERGHRHRSKRRRRQRRRRRRSQTSSGSDTSSGSRRHSGGSGASQSPYSSPRPQKSSSRLEASSSRRVRRRDRCRHCRHCKKHASSASSDDSRCRYSSEEEEEEEDGEDGGGSHRKAKKRRHRRVWRRSKWSKRGSSSTSSSSSSSSSTLLSVSPKKRPPLAPAEGQSSLPSEHAGERAEGETGTVADTASSSAPPCTSLLQPDAGHGTPADPPPSSRDPVHPDTGHGTPVDPPPSSRDPVQPETGHEALVHPPPSSHDPVQPETGHEALVDPPLSSRDPVQPETGHEALVDPPLSSRDPVQLDSNTAAESEPVTALGDSTSNAATEDPSVAAVPDVDAHEEDMDTDSGVSGAERVADRQQAQLSPSDVGRTHIRFSLSRKSPSFSVEVSQQREKRSGTDRKPDAQDLANTCAPPPGVSARRSTSGGAFGSGSATSRRPSSRPPPVDESMGVSVGLEDVELPGNGTVEEPIKPEGGMSDTTVSPQAKLRPSAPPEDEVLSKDRTAAAKSSGLAPVRSSAKHSEEDEEDACHSNTATKTEREANQNGSRGETLRTIPAEKSIKLPGEESLDVADSPRAGPQQERQKTRSPCLHDDVPDKAVDWTQRRPDEGHDQSTRRSRYSRERASSSHKAAHRNRDFSPRGANASKFESPRDRTSGNCYSPRRTNATHYDFASRESAKAGSERRDREFPSVHRAARRDDYGADFCHRSRDNFSTGFCGRSSFSARRRSRDESPSHLGWGSRHASWDRLYEQRTRDHYREDLHEATMRSPDWELSKTQSCRGYGDSTRNRTHESLEHRHGHGRERREENGHEQRRAKPAECFRHSDYVPSDTCRRHSPTVPTRHSSSERRRDAAKSVPVNSSREVQTKHRDDGPKSDERRSESTTRRRPSHSHSTSEHTGRERGRRPHRDKDPELCLNTDWERRVSPTGRRRRSRSSSGESTSARKVVRVHRNNDDESGSVVSCSKDRAHSGERSTDGGSSKTTPGSAGATCARGEGQTLKAGTRHGHERQDVRTLTRETSPGKDNRDHRAASGSPEGKTRRLWRWSKSRSNGNSLRASLSGRTSSNVQPSTLGEKQKSFNICQKGNSRGSEDTAVSGESATAGKGQSESSSMAGSENSVSRKPGLLPTPKPALLPTPDLALCEPDTEARCSAQSLPLIRSYGCSSKAVNWACSRQANGGLLDVPLRSEPARLVIRRSSDGPDDAKLKAVSSGKAGDHFKHRYSSSENSNDSSFIKTSPLLADASKRKLLETEVRKVKLVRLCREQDSLKTLIGTSCPGHSDTRHAPTLEADDRRRSNSDEKAGIKPRLRSTILLVQKPLDPFHSAKLTPPS